MTKLETATTLESEEVWKERQEKLRLRRSATEKIKRKFLAEGGKLKPGQGKGKEPDPLCRCHNRNPCPIDIELDK